MRNLSRSFLSRFCSKAGLSSRGGGFTLIELLLSTILGAMVVGSVVFMFANMAGAFNEMPSGDKFSAPFVDTTRYIPIAPAYSQLANAIQLQNVLMDMLQSDPNGPTNPSAACVFVLGGINEQGEGTVATGLPPTAYAPATLPWFATIHPSLISSAAQFKAQLVTNGVVLGAVGKAEDFSIFIISARSNVDAVVHCRRTDSAALATYTVTAYMDGAFVPELSYAYSVPLTDANGATVKPGAIHYWLRQNADWSLNDDLGAQVVFPDPTAVPYFVKSTDNSTTFSRFVLFMPTRP